MNDPRLFLHTSNRMEDLAAMLAKVLGRREVGDPFRAETVLVQSRGMGRWLSLQLADAQGVCFNLRFPFPREVIEEILSAKLPAWRTVRGLRRETLVWKIFRLFDSCQSDPRFRPIARYLEGDNLLRKIQLADRVGALFDQYLVYRPDWLLEWEDGKDADHWQAVLWRRLMSETDDRLHFGRAWQAVRMGAMEPVRSGGDLPSRLCVFGISSLPPLFLDILRSYAQEGELHLFLLQPTDQYWGDLVSKKNQVRMARGGKEAGACYVEEGHPLVASFGRQGQDLLNLLIDAEFQQSEQGESFPSPGNGTLLQRLQGDILLLADREKNGSERIEVAPDDDSIQVHSCHSPMREVEVLHDQLLDLFEKHRDLRPRDVLVMIPDIEAYAPYVQAVFGASDDQRARIPFAVVDRGPRSAHQAVDAWFRLLELSESRYGTRDVLGLLECGPFRLRFGLSDRDVNTLRAWIQATGIRWGIDARHREEQGLPPLDETTWQNGIDQWLLGYTMREYKGESAVSFGGIFPFDEIEGSNTGLLDRFLRALEFLFKTRTMLGAPRPLAAWCDACSELMEDFMGLVEELAQEADAIRKALTGLRKTAAEAGVETPVSLDVVRYFLEKTIEETVSRGGFLSGGVTFCTLQPMRTIPARVVCLLGMNDGDFPRRQQQIGFDLMRNDRRVGDRSLREDDRYLFLETLLSVRETLLVSYAGQSARDLSDAPPSVLVSELLDHLDRCCFFPEQKNARDFLVRRHRLQPFHADYFGSGAFFSFSKENAEASRRLAGERKEPPAFIQKELGEPEPEWRTIPVQQLVRFFRNPAEYFVKDRLGIRLPKEEPMLEDSEMFDVSSLDRYKLKKDAVDALIDRRETSAWRRLQARGLAPLGTPGLAACHSIEKEAKRFAERIGGLIGGGARSSETVDRTLGAFHLRGEIGPFFGDSMVIYRPAKLKAKDTIAGWIQHLLACWVVGASVETVLVAEDRMVILPPRADAEEKILELLGWYERGLREPLPFFPASAYAFQKALHGKKPATAREAARKAFEGTDAGAFSVAGEVEDPYIGLCWGGERTTEALGADFEKLAQALFVEIERFEKGVVA